MKILKTIARKLVSRLSRAWERAKEVDYESCLRAREAMEARERARVRFMHYGRGGWL